ncbi:MAG: cysteine--tRNA ligase [Chloroflexi bacterium]|nr:cysteine--tRNA ligase [Chloroflexota bacterium]
MNLFNTLSQQKEPFEPVNPGSKEVGIYVCGVTPYDTSHIGHAMVGVFFDTLHRYLEYLGYEVCHVQNLTDIDDDIIKRARRDGVAYDELGKRWNQIYLDSLTALNVQPFDRYIPASTEVSTIIEIVQGLVEKGFAYPARDGNVYFRAASFQDYGKLAHLGEQELLEKAQAGATDSLADAPGNPAKESDLDFIVWQAAQPNEPFWESPWGQGRPGWHIECSAIGLKHLGTRFEIHGGGADLIFPHHSSEIAQSEACSGTSPFVKYWMHVGMVHLGGEKMSKSLGNLVLVGNALKEFSPDALRLYLLSTHYRTPLHYEATGVTQAEGQVAVLRQALEAHSSSGGAGLEFAAWLAGFLTALDDDLDTPQAIQAALGLAQEIINASREGQEVSAAQKTLRLMVGLLGLFLASAN